MMVSPSPLSPNEVQFYFTRAAVGAGAPFGLGEEMSAAAIWLAGHGYDAAREVSPALNSLANGSSSSEIVISHEPGQFNFSSAVDDPLSVIYAGPAIADKLVIAATNSQPALITVNQVDQPALLVAYLASRIKRGVMRLTFTTPTAGADRVTIELDINGEWTPRIDDLLPAAVKSIEIHFQPNSAGKMCPDPVYDICHGINIDATSWTIIYGYFHKCLVPSTDISRIQGAGAGLTDND
jgi:hypothetical protein